MEAKFVRRQADVRRTNAEDNDDGLRAISAANEQQSVA